MVEEDMVKVAKIFQTGMVLQREKSIPVWGTAEPGKKIVVEIQGKSAKIAASRDGNWSVMLPPLSVSESERIVIRSEADEILDVCRQCQKNGTALDVW